MHSNTVPSALAVEPCVAIRAIRGTHPTARSRGASIRRSVIRMTVSLEHEACRPAHPASALYCTLCVVQRGLCCSQK